VSQFVVLKDFDGFIVCEEFHEILMDAWNTEVEEKKQKDGEKKEKRVLENWKKLVKRLLMHQKIRKSIGVKIALIK